MSELNSSQSNSKVSVSDQRIAAGHSGSSKNDISGISGEEVSNSTKGFAQLISKEGKVLMQREANSPEVLKFCDEKDWCVRDGARSVFVEETDHCHPRGFFLALHKTKIVHLFGGVGEPDELEGNKPCWVGMAKDVECIIEEEKSHYETFVALSESGEWLGTSEY